MASKNREKGDDFVINLHHPAFFMGRRMRSLPHRTSIQGDELIWDTKTHKGLEKKKKALNVTDDTRADGHITAINIAKVATNSGNIKAIMSMTTKARL